jgi:tetratricopeptide (TPR) repeat protein
MVPATSRVSRPARRPIIIAGGLAAIVAIAAGTAIVVAHLAGRDAAAARRALAEGRLDEASAALNRWLEASPGSAEAHYLKARLAWKRKDAGTVQAELERARALGYPAAQMADVVGLLLARTNQSAAAEPYLHEALDSGRPLDPEVAEALVRIYLSTFRLNEAGDVLDRWARAVPTDARPYLLRTEIETRTSREPEIAIGSYREALKRDPGLDQARLGLAEMLRISHHNAEATQEYATYMARKPEDPLGYLGAGQNAAEMGDTEYAVRWLDRAIELAPRNPVILAARATVEMRNHRFAEALVYLDRAVEADPFDHANRFQRMIILTRLGKKAQADAERQVLERIRRDQEEFSRIRDGLLASPQDPGLRSEAARWLMTHGHEQEAIEWANMVLAAEPSHPAMNRLLADYYRKRGQQGLANFHEALAPPPSARPGGTP